MAPKAIGILFLLTAVGLLGLFAWDTFFARATRKQLEAPFQSDRQDTPVEDELYEPEDGRITVRKVIDLDPKTLAKRRLTRKEWDAYVARKDYSLSTIEGDSWNSLADKYLGDASLKKRLLDANPTLDPRVPLKPGQTLIIPFRYRRPR